MTTTQAVLDFLSEEGFRPSVDNDNGNIHFRYEMRSFIFVNNDDDETFFQLVMPGIFDVTSDNRDIALEAANKVNRTTKVAKAVVFDEGVALFYEIILDQNPEVGSVLSRGLGILNFARQKFFEGIN